MIIRTSFTKAAAATMLILIGSALMGAAATFTVRNTNDTGAGSLRQAVADAGAAAGDDVINFDAGVFNTLRTITLGGTLITITGSGSLTINGPGAELLTIDGNSASRVFEVSNVVPATLGTVTFNNLTIANGGPVPNNGGYGAGIGVNNGAFFPAANAVTLTVNNVVFRNNRGGSEPGGAIGCTRSGTINVNNSTFTGNSANGNVIDLGSGIGTCSISVHNSSFYENNLVVPGGEIACCGNGDGTAAINTSAFYNNAGREVISAGRNGMTITNTTIANNRLINPAVILGTNSGSASFLTLTNVTIAGNSVSDVNLAAGLATGNINTLNIGNSIIANNTNPNGGADIAIAGTTTFNSQGYNLIENIFSGTIGGNTTGNIIGVDPLLDSLRDNGGATLTVNLRPGSPAIDAGNATTFPATDQRGIARPQDGDGNGTSRSDIGGFEKRAIDVIPPENTLGNISTRLRVETGDNVLIGGFIITGTQPKKVIVRAIGPSLPVAGKLANPTLELFGPSGLITSNDNWQESPNKQAIIDSTVPPSHPFESAIVATLPANATGYTAVVRGAGGATGIGLVEVYDLDRTVDSQLANISSRGFVQTGDNAMIGGFIITGNTSRKVIVRAIGPSLPVAGKLADPTLELFNANGQRIALNNNWRDTQQAEIIASMVPPTSDLESAIVSTLPPGNTTAVVRGNGDTTGVALVEVYALQ